MKPLLAEDAAILRVAMNQLLISKLGFGALAYTLDSDIELIQFYSRLGDRSYATLREYGIVLPCDPTSPQMQDLAKQIKEVRQL